eukprot:scaffold150859_cov18-Tisochrysis_lutea.AAC.1
MRSNLTFSRLEAILVTPYRAKSTFFLLHCPRTKRCPTRASTNKGKLHKEKESKRGRRRFATSLQAGKAGVPRQKRKRNRLRKVSERQARPRFAKNAWAPRQKSKPTPRRKAPLEDDEETGS